MIGMTDAEDKMDIRRQWLQTLGPKSVGILFERASAYTGVQDLEDDESLGDDNETDTNSKKGGSVIKK